MINHRYQRVASIMFDATGDKPFPTLDNLLGDSYEGRPDELARFLVVATDPARVRYFDDDSEAIDTTNFAVLRDALNDPAHIQETRSVDPATDAAEIEAALERGAAVYHGENETLLLVDPDDQETVSTFETLRERLSDYPLLDESAYSERDAEAWNDFLHGGLRMDTIRDLRERGIDDDTVDAIDDAWDALAPKAAENLNWYNGFTGEHAPDFADLISKTLVDAVAQVPETLFGPPGTSNDSDRRPTGGGGAARARLEAFLEGSNSPATRAVAGHVGDGLGSSTTREAL
jgi:hypothetical protein